MKRSWLIGLCLCSSLITCHSSLIRETDATNAILGESANQPYPAMLGIACAIRNRGTLHGVYGVNNLNAQHAPAKIRARAERAWMESAGRVGDRAAAVVQTTGCKFFGCPADANYFLHTLHFHAAIKIGDITFYKP